MEVMWGMTDGRVRAWRSAPVIHLLCNLEQSLCFSGPSFLGSLKGYSEAESGHGAAEPQRSEIISVLEQSRRSCTLCMPISQFEQGLAPTLIA